MELERVAGRGTSAGFLKMGRQSKRYFIGAVASSYFFVCLGVAASAPEADELSDDSSAAAGEEESEDSAVSSVRIPAGATERLVIPTLEGAIRLDGVLDDEAWAGVPVYEFTSHWPAFGNEPTERTELLVTHDDQYVYFGFRNFDSEADAIRVTSLKRDDMDFPSQDTCGVILDSFNDNETALGFFTNAAGLRADSAVAHDGEFRGEIPWTGEYDTFWDVAVHRDASGWFAEFRIPLSSLRYQTIDGEVTMGLLANRLIARKGELVTFPAVSPMFGFFSLIKPSLAKDVVFHGLERQTPVYLTPYLLTGVGQYRLDDGVAISDEHNLVLEVGADLKYPISSNLTIDLTLNTDFAQVEADNQQINLNRFSLFFPEKRRFFLERSSIFQFPMTGFDRVFHSRRIGFVEGQAVRIFGGVRAIAQVGKWDIGLLNMQTDDAEGIRPSENMGVARVRRQVLNDESYAGGIVTTRIDTDGDYNVVGGLDTDLRVYKNDYLSLNFIQSWMTEVAPPADPLPEESAESWLDPTFLRASYQRRRTDGGAFKVDLSRAGIDFVPGLGFIERRDYTRAAGLFGYYWTDAGGKIRQQFLGVDSVAYVRNSDGEVESAIVGPQWLIQTKEQANIEFRANYDHENVSQEFFLSPEASIAAGTYDFVSASALYGSRPGRILQMTPGIEAGQYFDGYRASASLGVNWKPFRYLRLDGSYRFDHIELPDRDQEFESHLALLRFVIMFNKELSISSFVQLNTSVGAAFGNTRLRYNFSEGHDLYLVYDESYGYREPSPAFLDRRTVLLKYTYTFDYVY